MSWTVVLIVGGVLLLVLVAASLGFVLGSVAAKAASQIGEGGDDD